MNLQETYKQAGLTVGHFEVAQPYSPTGKPLELTKEEAETHYFTAAQPNRNGYVEHWWPRFLRWVGNRTGCRWVANQCRALTLRFWR